MIISLEGMDLSHFKILSTEAHKEALDDIFASGEFVVGEHQEILENNLKETFNKKHCVLSSNGFSALFLSLMALNKKGMKVLMPAASTCYAIYNAILSSGNEVVFAGSDKNSGNICVKSAREITSKKKIDAIVSPNYFGIPSNIDELRDLKTPIIEDAAQSFMTNKQLGSRGDISIFSFYPSKIINGIDGGALLTDDDDLAKRAKDMVYYSHQSSADGIARFNFRMPNINAAYCLKSMKIIDDVSNKLTQLYQQYTEVCKRKGINYLGSNSDQKFVPNRFVLSFKNAEETTIHVKKLNDLRIGCSYELLDLAGEMHFPQAKLLSETSVSIPFHYYLEEEDMNNIIYALKSL